MKLSSPSLLSPGVVVRSGQNRSRTWAKTSAVDRSASSLEPSTGRRRPFPRGGGNGDRRKQVQEEGNNFDSNERRSSHTSAQELRALSSKLPLPYCSPNADLRTPLGPTAGISQLSQVGLWIVRGGSCGFCGDRWGSAVDTEPSCGNILAT